MNVARLRVVIGDIVNTAGLITLTAAVIGYLGGSSFVVVGAALAAAAIAFAAPMIVRPSRSLGLLERRAIRSYLAGEALRCRQELPAGITPVTTRGITPDRTLTMENFLAADSLFAEPTVDIVRGEPLSRGFVDWIVTAVENDRRVLVLGDPGQGKTLSCRLAYVHLIQEHQAGRLPVVPLFVRLSDVRDHLVTTSGEADPAAALARLLTMGRHPLPLSADRIVKLLAHRRFVVVLDGLDELAIHGATRRGAIPTVLEPALSGRVILSCRRAFYELYLEDSSAEHEFDAVALLQGVDFTTAGQLFIRRYCDHFRLDTADQLIELIEASPALQDLVTRPLILFMTTDVLAHKFEGVPGGAPEIEPAEWTIAEVYEHYVRKWLHLEQEKGAVLWHDMEELCELVAWRIFELAFDGRRAFGTFDNVADLVINKGYLWTLVRQWRPSASDARVAFEELTARSFLICADGGEYYRFAHKSFFEYFVARRIRTMLTSRHDDVVRLVVHLATPLPDEVVDFLRQMLHRCAAVPTDCSAIRENLFRVLEESASIEQTDAVVMLRQQAGNLAPNVLRDDPVGTALLLELYKRETHPFVRRGIAVGVALHLKDGRLIETLLDELETSEALSFHMGYNRIYYGDQHAGASGWRDDGTEVCDRFFIATLRQLSNPFYSSLWPMSVRTARVLLADPQRCDYLRRTTAFARHLEDLAAFVREHADDPWSALARESRALGATVDSFQ